MMWFEILWCHLFHSHQMIDLHPTGWRTVWGDDVVEAEYVCEQCGRKWRSGA